LAVDRGSAAAEVVVAHAGKVVVDERVGVQRLDGGGGPRRSPRDAVEAGGFEDQEAAQALPPSQA
jgi:hypothetical protein